jgi:hypothetical protein
MKTCTVCKIEQEDSFFVKRQSKCKMCIKAYNKEYRKLHKEEIYNIRKIYYNLHKDEMSKIQKEYRVLNKDKISIQRKEYRTLNKEIISSKGKLYYKLCKNKILLRNKKYYLLNKYKILNRIRRSKTCIITRRIRHHYRYNNDINYKIRKLISSSINLALQRMSSSKEGKSSSKYLSYPIEDLKKHLESLFEPWMNWNNWGEYRINEWDDNDVSTWKWQIDHIIPQSNLPYTSMEDENFKKCWALENLRPYSAKQNNIDRNRRKNK